MEFKINKYYRFLICKSNWCGIGYRKYNINEKTSWALIFDWILFLGYLKIWKWHNLKDGDIEKQNKLYGGKNNE